MSDLYFDLLDARIKNVIEAADKEKLEKRGGGNDNGGMEARVAKLEALAESTDRRLTTVEQDIRGLRSDQRQDFRITWGGLIAAVLAIAGLMAKGFNWL